MMNCATNRDMVWFIRDQDNFVAVQYQRVDYHSWMLGGEVVMFAPACRRLTMPQKVSIGQNADPTNCINFELI